MIKITLYPKTKRVGKEKEVIEITEKLDGSNIGFFRLDDELIVAKRNEVYTLSEIINYDNSKNLYKSLYEWLKLHGEELKQSLNKGSGFFGEWLGQGKIKYDESNFDKKVYMFAKANIDTDLNVKNIYYNHSLLKYPFIDQQIPDFVGIVPLVKTLDFYPNIEALNTLYESYMRAKKFRNVEGFVINDKNSIQKYVRFKNGKLTDHIVK